MTAPYAATYERSRGRVHPEPRAGGRGYALDCHRILSCAAFRRLQYKTQVFVNDEGDHFRTRLTHTLEVLHLARQLARELDLDVELTEAVALAHDLGHPPFGHAGERALAECMAGHGGFEHNLHAHRVVTYLEHPYPAFRGLNLAFEVRECLVKHTTAYDQPRSIVRGEPDVLDLLGTGPCPPLEGQVVNLADELAYLVHDLHDAVMADLISEPMLAAWSAWRAYAEPVRSEHPDRPLPAILRSVLDRMVDAWLADAVATTRRNLAEAHCRSLDDVRRSPEPLVRFSPAARREMDELRLLLEGWFYRHPRLLNMDARAHRTVTALFEHYAREPSALPPRFARRIDEQGIHRVVCDYIAGMTDRFCQEVFRRQTT